MEIQMSMTKCHRDRYQDYGSNLTMSFSLIKNGTLCHWYLQCTAISVYARTNLNWEISEQRPTDKKRCQECRQKRYCTTNKRKIL